MDALPEGTEPPDWIPPAAFAAALAAYESGGRLDMSGLAAELGIGRATLYRRVGSRERLLGEVLWQRSRLVLDAVLRATAELHGAARLVAIVEQYLATVTTRPELHAFIERETAAALRILTSQESPVHAGLRRTLEAVVAAEEERGALTLTIDRGTLAYVIVRLGESLLYADRLDRPATPVDHRTVVDVVARLLAGSQVGALPSPQLAGAETTDALSRATR